MKKIFITLLMFVFAATTALGFVYANEKPHTLVIHYYRFDGNYNNKWFHFWEKLPQDKIGKDYQFNSETVDEYGVKYEMDLTDEYISSTRVGIIIKTAKSAGDWSGEREPGGDRFIDISELKVINGVAHVYFVQGQVQFGKSNDDLANHIPDYRSNIINVFFTVQKNVSLELTNDATSYKVYENSVVIKENTLGNGVKHTITGINVDLTKTYEIEVTFEDTIRRQPISLHKLYDTVEFEEAFTYEGELGAIYSKSKTTFRLWAPISSDVKLNIYNQGHPNYDRLGQKKDELTPVEVHQMYKIENGVWEVVLEGDYDSKYYTFSVTNGQETNEVTDPYSYSTGANGLRSMVVDFNKNKPLYWDLIERPQTIRNMTDYIIYELHVRDLTSHSSWNGNNAYRGKFLGLSQTGTSYTQGNITVTTGLDHIEELGVNAVHLLPVFDFGYLDEVEIFHNPNTKNVFNWGYMPYHFNTLEGSYSTNPFDGNVRIYEFREVIKAFSQKNIRVIMDVVYNHTGESENSNFHKILPGYYHRLTNDGAFSNGSGTGNETASERTMVRKFIVDSVKYFANEFKISGFRFDLMSIHDIETMNSVRNALNEIDPTIIVYGEPWSAASTLVDPKEAAGMTPENNWDRTQIRKLDNHIAAFNDLFRNAVKGSPDGNDGGFLQGVMDQGKMNDIKKSILGGTDLYTNGPTQQITYIEAHDNLTLHDKLRTSGVSINDVKFAQTQANAMVLTSLGIPFLHAGTEFLRSKPKDGGGYDHNSYESPDEVNQLRWDRKVEYLDVFEYTKVLIHIRNTYSHFKMTDLNEINQRFEFLPTSQDNNLSAIAYRVKGINGEPDIVVVHNGRATTTTVALNDGKTYNLLTSKAASSLLFDTQKGLAKRSNQLTVTSMNTTNILVEMLETGEIIVQKPHINVALNSSFNPLSNISIPSSMKVYTTPIDTSKPGFSVVTIMSVDYLGNKNVAYYTVFVNGGLFAPTVTFRGV